MGFLIFLTSIMGSSTMTFGGIAQGLWSCIVWLMDTFGKFLLFYVDMRSPFHEYHT